MSYHPATRDYRDRHLEKRWTISAVFRALKRAIAREVLRALTGHCLVPPTTATPDQPAEPRTSPSPQPRSTSRPGHHVLANSNSADARTTTSPTATANDSKPLDTQ